MSTLGASSKIGGGKRLAPPSPSPSNASNASNGGTPSKRQKRDHNAANAGRGDRTGSPPPAAKAAAAAATSYGSDMMTQLTYAVDFLKSKGTPKTLQDILDHLSLQRMPEETQKHLALMMRRHPRMTYIPVLKAKSGGDKKGGDKDRDRRQEPGWMQGTYEFRAKIPGVKDKISLLAHLQAKTDASTLSVKDLKDGWPNCDKAIDELEADHKILVVRTKKDNHAKFLWLDSPQLAHAVDPEFKAMWHRVEVPSVDDIVRRLVAVGQKPASEDPRLKKLDGPKTMAKPKKRANRANKHQQNEHMKHLLQDYSHLKR